MSELDAARQRYAEKIRTVVNLRSQKLVAAFAKVPREHFLGPGPWQIMTPGLEEDEYRTTIDDNPVHLYDDILVAIDPSRHLNNGQPSYLGFCLDSLDLREGDRVCHVGCGVGYYTAVMAEVVGPAGHVIGIEIDPDLTLRACRNLANFEQVEVVHGDGGQYDPGPCDAIFVNAGATHPRSVWLDCLGMGSRLVFYLTATSNEKGAGRGGMLKVRREGQGYAACFLSAVAVFHCIGSRDAEANRRLRRAMMRGGWESVQSLRRDTHDMGEACWLHGNGFCLSTLPVPAAPGHG